MSFLTREDNILDHVYSNVKGAYKAAPRANFGQSNHISVFLYLSYDEGFKKAYVEPSETPRDSTEWSWRDTTPCGSACNTSEYQQLSREVTTSQSALQDALNEFYTRFDTLNTNRGTLHTEAAQSSSLKVTSAMVCRALRRTNTEGLLTRAGWGANNILTICPSHNLLCPPTSRPPPLCPSLRKTP